MNIGETMIKTMNQKSSKAQSQRFIDVANALGCDESEEHFDAALKKVAAHKPTIEDVSQKSDAKSAAVVRRLRACLEGARRSCRLANVWRHPDAALQSATRTAVLTEFAMKHCACAAWCSCSSSAALGALAPNVMRGCNTTSATQS